MDARRSKECNRFGVTRIINMDVEVASWSEDSIMLSKYMVRLRLWWAVDHYKSHCKFTAFNDQFNVFL